MTKEDHQAEMRIRDLIIAEHVLSLVEERKKYHPVPVAVEDLQAVLRLLDEARLNTKVKKL